jgi:hypothetical protein
LRLDGTAKPLNIREEWESRFELLSTSNSLPRHHGIAHRVKDFQGITRFLAGTYQEEFLALLKRHRIEYEEGYLWD